jgi:membrane fusion protein (multidrug efflux system)
MMKRMLIMLTLLVLFFGALFGWKTYVNLGLGRGSPDQFPPVTISATRARAETWTPALTAIGTLETEKGVNVTAQAPGIITALYFGSGAEVGAGDLLVQQFIDDDLARLDALKAEIRLAEITLQRATELVRDRLVPQLDLDTAESNLDRIQAELKSVQVTIDKKSIRAPFAGQLGIRRVNIGQYIQPGDDIVKLESLQNILVVFPLPQRHLPQVHVGQTVEVSIDAYPERSFGGEINAIEPEVNQATRSFWLQATLPNESMGLRPGMFAEVSIPLAVEESVVTVPQSAITFSPYGDSVYVVQDATGASGQPEPTVRNVFVTTGATRGDQVAIVDGLAAGKRIVTSGQLKLRNGSRVIIDNSVAVSDSAQPIPKEN